MTCNLSSTPSKYMLVTSRTSHDHGIKKVMNVCMYICSRTNTGAQCPLAVNKDIQKKERKTKIRAQLDYPDVLQHELANVSILTSESCFNAVIDVSIPGPSQL